MTYVWTAANVTWPVERAREETKVQKQGLEVDNGNIVFSCLQDYAL